MNTLKTIVGVSFVTACLIVPFALEAEPTEKPITKAQGREICASMGKRALWLKDTGELVCREMPGASI